MDPVTTDLGLEPASLRAQLDELADEDNERSVISRIADVNVIVEELHALLARAMEVHEYLEEHRPVAPVLDFNEPLRGGQVRQAAATFAGGFTINELAAELDREPKDVKRFLKPMELDGRIRDTGERIGRTVIYEYLTSEPVPGANVKERPRRPPPEIATKPAGDLRMATGEPVRVPAQKKITRRGRSTPGVGHRAKQTDLRYERMQAARNGGKKKESVQEANRRAAADAGIEKLRKKAKRSK